MYNWTILLTNFQRKSKDSWWCYFQLIRADCLARLAYTAGEEINPDCIKQTCILPTGPAPSRLHSYEYAAEERIHSMGNSRYQLDQRTILCICMYVCINQLVCATLRYNGATAFAAPLFPRYMLRCDLILVFQWTGENVRARLEFWIFGSRNIFRRVGGNFGISQNNSDKSFPALDVIY